MALLSAMAIVLVNFIRLPLIPSAQFLEYDPADVPILLAAYFLGPLAGVAVTIVVSVIQGITVSAASGPWGIVMHICATGTMALIVGLVSRPGHFGKRTIIAAITGAAAMIAIMIPLNLIITPIYTGAPRSAVVAMLPTAIIPFNAIKAGINSTAAFGIYAALHGLVPNTTKRGNR